MTIPDKAGHNEVEESEMAIGIVKDICFASRIEMREPLLQENRVGMLFGDLGSPFRSEA